MCMNCGCGDVNTRHKRGDIILDDLEKAAKNHNMDVPQVVRNIQESGQKTGGGSASI
jgi:hypothetical protein